MYAWIYVAPIVLLVVTWTKVLRADYFEEAPRIAWPPLVLASATEVYLALCSVSRGIIGPPYSNLRFNIIHLNLAAALLAAVAACFWKSVAQWWLVAASLTLALQWLFVDAINHVV